jgi:hypothetical protein
MCLHLTLLVSVPFLLQFLTPYLIVGQVLILPDSSCHETSMMQLHSFESLKTLFMIAGFLDFVHHVVFQTIQCFRNHIYFCPEGNVGGGCEYFFFFFFGKSKFCW